MKIFILSVLFASQVVKAQIPDRYFETMDDYEKDEPTPINLSTSVFYTGSGHGAGFVLGLGNRNAKRSIDIALIYDGEQSRLAGMFGGAAFFLNPDKQSNSKIMARSYIVYNILYQTKEVVTSDVLDLDGVTFTTPEEEGEIGSMEHYLSFGYCFTYDELLSLKVATGVGRYFGSLEKNKASSPIAIAGYNGGFTMYFNMTLSVILCSPKDE